MKDAIFDNRFDCPLAKACKRHFGSEDLNVLNRVVFGPNKTTFDIISDSIVNQELGPAQQEKGFWNADFKQAQLNLEQDPTYIHKITLQQYIPVYE